MRTVNPKILLVHRVMNELADSLLKVFIPILIYKELGSIGYAAAYLGGYYVLQSLLNMTLGRYMTAKPVVFILLRLIPVLATQYLLVAGHGSLLLYGLIASTACANAFYWVPLNYLFASSAGKAVGKATGRFRAASVAGKIIGPGISGIVLTYFGIEAVSTIAITFFVASIVVLLVSYLSTGNEAKAMSSIVEAPLIAPVAESSAQQPQSPFAAIRIYLVSSVLSGFSDTADIFWSLYVYTVSAAFIDVGFVAVFIQFGVLGANLVIGKLTDVRKWLLPALLPLLAYAAIWIVRPYAMAPISVFTLSAAGGFLVPFFTIPIFANFVKESKQTHSLSQCLVSREVALKGGGTISIAGYLATGMISMPFILAGVASLLLAVPLLRIFNRIKAV
ncbi:MFS transporter [Paenibacillus lignilyticus]|uniref:MFS transporter n=1 Tax=Paenibacillus lignilyticus TaxID=1172615 RepID=A0ABS5CK11_9BACL|nr:MFS transporter [Paenibacillus lignilyticus]MBP3966213.1 MFS transporter [Paenibacillus lignilyticus]